MASSTEAVSTPAIAEHPVRAALLLPDARTFTGVAAMPRPKAFFRCGYRERSRGKEAFWLTQDLTDRIRNIDRPAKLAFAAKVLGEALEVSRVGCGVVDLRPNDRILLWDLARGQTAIVANAVRNVEDRIAGPSRGA